MSQSRETLLGSVQAWNQDGRLYVVVGLITAVLSIVFIPLLGLVAVYCGYKLYDTQDRTVLAVALSGTGAFGFLWWVYYLTTL